jgi:uncharacterized LabA/DUF88 family protein
VERVTVFVDGSNFYHGLKTNNCPTNIDFYKLSALMVGNKRKLIRTYYYNAIYDQNQNPQEYAKQSRFFNALKSTPYLVTKIGRLEKRTAKVDKEHLIEIFGVDTANKLLEKIGKQIVTYVEKGIDINIASDMLKLAYNNSYDTAILISGDGDFVPAVSAVQDLGKHVENVYLKKGRSNNLTQTCDKFTALDLDFINQCLLR